MFTPAPMDESFVPYTKRPIRKNNSRLFVNGGKGRSRGAARVVPQMRMYDPCPPGWECQRCLNDQGWCSPKGQARVCLTDRSPDCPPL